MFLLNRIKFSYFMKDIGPRWNIMRERGELVFLKSHIYFLNHRGVDTHVKIIFHDYLQVGFLSLSSDEFSRNFFFFTNETKSF